MKKILLTIKLALIKTVTVVISIGLFLAVIMFFRWGGLRGLIGFGIGVMATGFVFLSDNPFIQVYRELIIK